MIHTSLDSLIERVIKQNEAKYDVLADTRRMSVVVEQEGDLPVSVGLQLDGEAGLEMFAPSEHMLGQMATDLGIPKRYFDRMKVEAPDLFKQNVHHWFYQEPKRRMLRSFKVDDTYRNGRAWLSDRYRRLDNIEIATRLLPEFGRLPVEPVFHNASITDERFYLRAMFPRMEKEVRVGDTVQWGVQIKNSEVGAGQFDISSYLLRLICKNGMVVGQVMAARHVGKRLGENLSDEAVKADDHAFWLAARDELRASLDEAAFESVVATLRETTEGETITSPIAATKRLASTFSLSEEEHEAVLLNLSREGDMTRWGALNAVTAAAQTVENFDRGVEMEEMGWQIAEMSQRDWGRIAVAG
jgi:Domain of unknown function (DUF932)